MFSVWIGCLVSNCPIIKLFKFCIETERFWKTIVIFYMDVVKLSGADSGFVQGRSRILCTQNSDFSLIIHELHHRTPFT